VTLHRRGAIVLTLAIAQTAIYLWLNHHPLIPSRELPLTAIDRALPFLPWSVWIYLALLSSEGVLALGVRDDATFRRMVVAYTLAMSLAFLTYACWPTRFPRPQAPEPGSWGGAGYRWLVAIDAPECCFPSGHVIVPAIVCFSLARDRRRRWPVILFVLLVPSVLTTKQHYFWDVIAGIVIAAAALIVAATLDQRRGRQVAIE
jgi:membrane-associated phospholipid phosphatase